MNPQTFTTLYGIDALADLALFADRSKTPRAAWMPLVRLNVDRHGLLHGWATDSNVMAYAYLGSVSEDSTIESDAPFYLHYADAELAAKTFKKTGTVTVRLEGNMHVFSAGETLLPLQAAYDQGYPNLTRIVPKVIPSDRELMLDPKLLERAVKVAKRRKADMTLVHSRKSASAADIQVGDSFRVWVAGKRHYGVTWSKPVF